MPVDPAKKEALLKKGVIVGVVVLVAGLGYNFWSMSGAGKKPATVLPAIPAVIENAPVHVQASLQETLQNLRDRMIPSEELSRPATLSPEEQARQAQKYNAFHTRDPFDNLLWKYLPPPAGSAISVEGGENGEAAASGLPAIEVQGVLWGGKDPLVVIEDSLYKVGDTVKGATIKSIERAGVTISYGSVMAVLTVPREGTAKVPSQSQWR